MRLRAIFAIVPRSLTFPRAIRGTPWRRQKSGAPPSPRQAYHCPGAKYHCERGSTSGLWCYTDWPLVLCGLAFGPMHGGRAGRPCRRLRQRLRAPGSQAVPAWRRSGTPQSAARRRHSYTAPARRGGAGEAPRDAGWGWARVLQRVCAIDTVGLTNTVSREMIFQGFAPGNWTKGQDV